MIESVYVLRLFDLGTWCSLFSSFSITRSYVPPWLNVLFYACSSEYLTSVIHLQDDRLSLCDYKSEWPFHPFEVFLYTNTGLPDFRLDRSSRSPITFGVYPLLSPNEVLLLAWTFSDSLLAAYIFLVRLS